MSERRIREWYDYHKGEVVVSFSGGKDSTVTLRLVRSVFPKVPAVFVDTGLEFPEIRDFVKTIDNVTWLKPKMSFKKVIENYGYPVVSKMTASKLETLQNPTENNKRSTKLYTTGINSKGKFSPSMKIANKWLYLKDAPFKISEKCCGIMKKGPLMKYQKETGRSPYIGVMACDSRNRELTYKRYGCNAYDLKSPYSAPIGFWLEQDVWDYLRQNDIPYSKIYDMGYSRTGCVFCMFGAHMNKPNRFQILKTTHPKLHKYCMEKLGLKRVLDYVNIPTEPKSSLFDQRIKK